MSHGYHVDCQDYQYKSQKDGKTSDSCLAGPHAARLLTVTIWMRTAEACRPSLSGESSLTFALWPTGSAFDDSDTSVSLQSRPLLPYLYIIMPAKRGILPTFSIARAATAPPSTACQLPPYILSLTHLLLVPPFICHNTFRFLYDNFQGSHINVQCVRALINLGHYNHLYWITLSIHSNLC